MKNEKPPKRAHDFGNLTRARQQMFEQRVTALEEVHSEATVKNLTYRKTNLSIRPSNKEKFFETLDTTKFFEI